MVKNSCPFVFIRGSKIRAYPCPSVVQNLVSIRVHSWFQIRVHSWLGHYKITQSGDEHPDFLYIGQADIANPISTTNFDQLLSVDYIDGDCSTTPLRIVTFEWMTPGKILIEWTSEPGSDYQVQALPPEEDADWQSISPVIPATTALTSWEINAIPEEKSLMLRVLRVE
jgi:hypothetical protein